MSSTAERPPSNYFLGVLEDVGLQGSAELGTADSPAVKAKTRVPEGVAAEGVVPKEVSSMAYFAVAF